MASCLSFNLPCYNATSLLARAAPLAVCNRQSRWQA
jgi:hypothetical protein